MRLTPPEEERLLIFTAAELARRHRSAGLPLNQPETIALICDAMLEAARAGVVYYEVAAAGRAAVGPDDVMPGVRALVDEVRLEVLMGDGTRLIVLRDPLAGDERSFVDPGPGAIRAASAGSERSASAGGAPGGGPPPARETLELAVLSESRRVIRVSSHYPFHRVNRRLVFDRDATRGFRLDLPAGASERWAPGETRTVRLIRYGGEGGGSDLGGGGGR